MRFVFFRSKLRGIRPLAINKENKQKRATAITISINRLSIIIKKAVYTAFLIIK
ncbi:hypothetical protein [Piscirickettsia salmonis]|uniref:hypothetical protein n=1 Tax=Piscirickettsia salmonis TaxID=1238 RepID=UPI0012BA9796|nr:hypothetical protein [Piscirickettsia salmonis]